MKKKSGGNLNAEVSASCVTLQKFAGAYISSSYLPLRDDENPLYREDIFLYEYPLYVCWRENPRSNGTPAQNNLTFLVITKDAVLSAELKVWRARFYDYDDFRLLCEKSPILKVMDECSNAKRCFELAEQFKGVAFYFNFDYDKYLTRVGVPTCLYPECVRQLNTIRKQANKELWAIKKGLK